MIGLINTRDNSPADPKKRHGTEDRQPKMANIMKAVRKLKWLVDQDPKRKDVPAPIYVAESYAAAATGKSRSNSNILFLARYHR